MPLAVGASDSAPSTYLLTPIKKRALRHFFSVCRCAAVVAMAAVTHRESNKQHPLTCSSTPVSRNTRYFSAVSVSVSAPSPVRSSSACNAPPR